MPENDKNTEYYDRRTLILQEPIIADPHKMNNRGITLIELIVVVTVIAILVVALGFEFRGWVGGYRVESQVKEIYVDLMNARARAMQRNRAHFVDFPIATQYRIQEDTNDDNVSDTTLPTFPKTVGYTINWDGGGTIRLDNRGVISFPTIDADPAVVGIISLTLPADVTPDYDCIELGPTRINMGLITGGICVAR